MSVHVCVCVCVLVCIHVCVCVCVCACIYICAQARQKKGKEFDRAGRPRFPSWVAGTGSVRPAKEGRGAERAAPVWQGGGRSRRAMAKGGGRRHGRAMRRLCSASSPHGGKARTTRRGRIRAGRHRGAVLRKRGTGAGGRGPSAQHARVPGVGPDDALLDELRAELEAPAN